MGWDPLLTRVGRTDAASRALQEALGIIRDVARKNPDIATFRHDEAFCRECLGNLQVATGRLDEALQSYREVLDLVGRAARDTPGYGRSREGALESQLGIGRALLRQGRVAEALTSLGQAVALGTAIAGRDPEVLHNLARAQALCSTAVGQGRTARTTEERTEAERYAAAAVKTLSQAVAAGYRNLPWIKRDPDLDPLRSRDDFQGLVNELERAQAVSE